MKVDEAGSLPEGLIRVIDAVKRYAKPIRLEASRSWASGVLPSWLGDIPDSTGPLSFS